MLSKLLLTALAFVTVSAHAANVPQAASAVAFCGQLNVSTAAAGSVAGSLTIPEGSLTSLGYKVLTAGFKATTANGAFYGFHDISGGSNTQYSVPNSKNFYVVCWAGSTNSATPVSYQFVSSTAAIASEGTTTIPTGPIYTTGRDCATDNCYNFFTGINASTYGAALVYQYPLKFTQNTFISVQTNSSASQGGIILVGKEAN